MQHQVPLQQLTQQGTHGRTAAYHHPAAASLLTVVRCSVSMLSYAAAYVDPGLGSAP
jgi:hypothetical protein